MDTEKKERLDMQVQVIETVDNDSGVDYDPIDHLELKIQTVEMFTTESNRNSDSNDSPNEKNTIQFGK